MTALPPHVQAAKDKLMAEMQRALEDVPTIGLEHGMEDGVHVIGMHRASLREAAPAYARQMERWFDEVSVVPFLEVDEEGGWVPILHSTGRVRMPIEGIVCTVKVS